MGSARILTLLAAAGLVTAACSGPSAASRPAGTGSAPSAPAAGGGRVAVRVSVPLGEERGAFESPRDLILPRGWTASVWARLPDARMAAWTPAGALLVSQPDLGQVSELTPGPGGTGQVRTVLSGLTLPQGLAFARQGGRPVLYLAESGRIDRYAWRNGRISGARQVVAGRLPDLLPDGDDNHRLKDVTVAPDGGVYFNVGSASNATPSGRSGSPPRATIMAVDPDGRHLRVVEKGVRNGEGLAVAPDGTVWTAVNNRDNVSYPFHRAYAGHADAFGQVIQAYVNEHPLDEVVPVTPGRDLGWPYCNPDQSASHPAGSLARVPFVPDAITNPGGRHLNCGTLPPVQAGLPAHSAPLGLTFVRPGTLPAPYRRGALVAVHGSWNRTPPRPPAVLWLAWDAAHRTLTPPVTLIGGFQVGTGRWGRPADAVPGPDGALYVTDDQAGAVYRLVPGR